MTRPVGKTVATCPKCGAAIEDSHPYSWCVACGEQLPDAILARLPVVQSSRAATKAAVAAERAVAQIPSRPRIWVGVTLLAVSCVVIILGFWEPFSIHHDWSRTVLASAIVVSSVSYGIAEIVAARKLKKQTRR
jgi:hypothetical protein